MKKTLLLGILLASFGLATRSAKADSITFAIPAGTMMGGQPVSATATFITSTNSIVVVLTNTVVNPTSLIQNLTGLSFALSTGQNSGTLTSSSGLERTVASNGLFTDGSAVATGWALSTNGSQLQLSVLGTSIGPAHTIVGAPSGGGIYGNANGSIAANRPHNPFLAEPVTFNLSVSGVTSSSTITSATFSFGTMGSNDVTVTPVPEPGSLILVSSGLLGLWAKLRRRRVV